MRRALSMMKQDYCVIGHFSVLNECLRLLSKSSLGAVERLRMEAKIIRMKKLLLVHGPPVTASAPQEDPFEDLLCRMRRYCGAGEHPDAPAMLERMRAMLVLLGDDHAGH